LLSGLEALAKGKTYLSPTIAETMLDYFLEHHNGNKRASVLTTREREFIQLIAEGKTNRQGARTLGISVKTVDSHRAAVMEKLKFHRTAEPVLYAVRNEIVLP
jgi:DNA-binding NarL/FixJ family response regulator